MSIIGNAAPAFSSEAAKDGEIVNISLDDYKGKWLCLFFYPMDFTFVCPTELVAFSDRAADFNAAGCEILGVSIDSAHTHMAWMRTPRADAGVGALNYPLLADVGGKICSDYDVLNDENIAFRGLFLIDPEGIVQHSTVNNLPVGRNVDEVIRLIHAFQFTKESGNVCPANWTQGDSGMSATLDGVKGHIG